MSKKVECPYCEKMVEMDAADGCENWDQQCTECGKVFEVIVECNPTYSAIKIKNRTCRDCGKKFRFIGGLHPKPDKYNHLKGKHYVICDKCFRIAQTDDWLPLGV